MKKPLFTEGEDIKTSQKSMRKCWGGVGGWGMGIIKESQLYHVRLQHNTITTHSSEDSWRGVCKYRIRHILDLLQSSFCQQSSTNQRTAVISKSNRDRSEQQPRRVVFCFYSAGRHKLSLKDWQQSYFKEHTSLGTAYSISHMQLYASF